MLDVDHCFPCFGDLDHYGIECAKTAKAQFKKYAVFYVIILSASMML